MEFWDPWVRLLLRITTSMSLSDELPVVVIGAGGHAVLVSSLFRLECDSW